MELLQTLERVLANLGIRTDITVFFAMFGLVVARLATAISLSPFLGGMSVPARVKVGLAVLVATLLYPGIAAREAGQEVASLLFVALLVKEVMIGATIGFVSQLVFFAVQMAGTVIDTQRGMNQITYLAPQLQGHTSAIGILKLQAALVVFFILGGHLLFLRALSDSYEMVPVASFPQFQSGLLRLMEQAARLTAETLVIALQLSAPVLVALFLVDVAFGAIGKVTPQLNVHNESQPVKSLVGLALVFLTVALILDRLKVYLAEMIQNVYSVMKTFA